MASSNFDASSNNKDLQSYVMSVGISFVNAYYKQLGEDPAGLAYFFAADSHFTWVEADQANSSEPVGTTSFGRDAIVARLKQLKLDHAQVHITSVHCQPSVNHAVIVQVVGEITPNQQHPTDVYQFTQAFFLVKVAHKFRYYCYNDCFRYISATPVAEAAPATTHEEPEYPVKAAPAAAPASPQRHEGNILGGSDPIAPASHSASHPSAGVIGPASTSTSAVAAPTTAAKEEAPASPINLAQQFTGATGGYGAIGSGTYHAEQNADWAAEEQDEEPEIVAKPEPEPTPVPEAKPTPAPRQQPAKETAPAASKGWNTIEKVAPVPIATQSKAAAQSQAAPAPVQEESEEEDTGKPSTWLDILKRKQRKGAAPASGPVTVQAPASAPKVSAQDNAGARAKLAQERKDFEAREAEKRRPREPLPERRPRNETPRFGVFVGKMPSEAADKDVSEVFQAFGPVANVRIPQGKRVAFVDFQTEAGRNAAITAGKATILGQQVVITEPQQNPAGDRKPQGERRDQGKTQAPRPKAGAKTGGKQ